MTDRPQDQYGEITVPPAAIARMRATVMDEADRTSAPRRRRRAVMGAVSVAIVLVAVFGLLTAGGGSRTGVTPAAAAVFSQAALTAENQAPLPPLTPGHYLYRKTGPGIAGLSGWQRVMSSRFGASVDWVEEQWIAPDASNTQRLSVVAGPRFPTAALKAQWVAAGRPAPWRSARVIHSVHRFYYPTGRGLNYRQLIRVEQDPGQLQLTVEHAARATGARTAEEVRNAEFSSLTLMLTYDPLQPRFRAEAFRLLAAIPGVKNAGRLDAYLGRPAVYLTYRMVEPGRSEVKGVVIDPQTSELLGRSQNGLIVCCYTPWKVVDSTTPRPNEPAGASVWLPTNAHCSPECIMGTVRRQRVKLP